MALDDHAPAAALPCGTLLDDLIAQVADGSGPLDRVHQATCRHCQTALDAIREAWEEFQLAAKAAISLPEGLAERILARVRPLSRAVGDGVMISDSLGETRVAPRVLARVARASALGVSDVLVATVLDTHEDPDEPGSIAVALRLVVAFGPSVDGVAAEVRQRVDRALRAQAGVGASRVDVSIEDIVSTPAENA
jgi:hypothetical protein